MLRLPFRLLLASSLIASSNCFAAAGAAPMPDADALMDKPSLTIEEFEAGRIGLRAEGKFHALDAKTIEDLELGSIEDKLHGFAHTPMAKERISWLLKNPSLDRVEIRERQKTIRLIAENEELFQTLDREFGRFADWHFSSRKEFLKEFRTFKGFPIGYGIAFGGAMTVAFFGVTTFEAFSKLLADPTPWFNAPLTESFKLLGTLAPAYWIAQMKSVIRSPLQSLMRQRNYEELRPALAERDENAAKLREIFEVCESERSCRRWLGWSRLTFPTTTWPRGLMYATVTAALGVLPAHVTLQVKRERVVRFIAAMAELETYLAFAKYYRENRERGLVFPEYRDEPSAYHRIEGGQHPHQFFSGEESVPNDVTLDERGDFRAFVITGPNAGGKTTFQQMYMSLAVMGQMGLPVPARAMESVPFRVFTNFTRNTGSVVSGKSTFVKQSQRAVDVLDTVEKSDTPSLAAFDEILTGTSTAEHQALEHAVVRVLAETPGVLMTVATHDRSLTGLEDELQGAGVGNLQVSLEGHRILPGPSHEFNAFKIMEGVGASPKVLAYARGYFEKFNPDLCVKALGEEPVRGAEPAESL